MQGLEGNTGDPSRTGLGTQMTLDESSSRPGAVPSMLPLSALQDSGVGSVVVLFPT